MMRRDEHHDLLVTATFADNMPSNGPESTAKQVRHDVNDKNTNFVLEGAGQPLQGAPGFSGYQPPSLRQIGGRGVF